MKRSNFVELAMRTCSPNFYANRVGEKELRHAVNEFITAANRLDKIKKSLFYNRDNNLEGRLGETNSNGIVIALTAEGDRSEEGFKRIEQIIHAIFGIATEAGELMEALRKAYNGEPIDSVNLMEECGDVKWYQALLANACGFEWGEDEVAIIAKLRKRFPDAYTDDHANNRDLDGERLILEQGTSVIDYDDDQRPAVTIPFKRMEQLMQVTEISKSPGNAGANDYMRGLANGLILALATVQGTDVEYIEPPAEPVKETEWLPNTYDGVKSDVQVGGRVVPLYEPGTDKVTGHCDLDNGGKITPVEE